MLFATTTIPIRTLPLRHHHSTTFFRRNSTRTTSIKMSSSNIHQIIEHIVLFKTSQTATPSSISTMLNNLNSLSSLSSVLHLSAGPISNCRSNSLTFTHMLHSRYASKLDLATYTDHPDHVSVVTKYVKPVVEDVMAVDWVAEDFSGVAEIEKGSVARFTVLKLKDESKKDEVLESLKEGFNSVGNFTVGENFSPGRAKGYSIGSVAVLKGSEELEGLGTGVAGKEFVEDALVLDFVVGAAVGAASL